MLLAIHVLLCIYFSVTPRNYILHRSAIGSLYHRVFLIGPFFTEERITSSTQLYMRYKVKGGSWSEAAACTDRVHQAGTSVLFRYNDLKHDDLLRYFAKAYSLHKTEPEKSDKQLCVMCRYSINEFIPPGQVIDSINLLFIHNTFLKNSTVGKSDTVWNVTLNPERCVVR
jgi:hypothetical protein